MNNKKQWKIPPIDGNVFIKGYIIEYTNLTIDSDGDGILDYHDNCPDIFNQDQEVYDGDGQGFACNEENMLIAHC